MHLDGGTDDLVRQRICFRLCVSRVFVFHVALRWGSGGRGDFLDTKNGAPTHFTLPPPHGWRTTAMMWCVREGKLYCGRDPVAVRRVIVEMVAGRATGAIPEQKARAMIRMERALSLRSLSKSLQEGMP